MITPIGGHDLNSTPMVLGHPLAHLHDTARFTCSLAELLAAELRLSEHSNFIEMVQRVWPSSMAQKDRHGCEWGQ